MWYRFTTSNLQRYKFIQIETRIETTHLAVGKLPSVYVQKLNKKTKEKNLIFCEALVLWHLNSKN